MPSFLFPFRASTFHFSLPFSSLCFYFLFSRFHLSYCNWFSLAATMPPHQWANDCRMWTRPPRHDLCYRSLCFVDQCYLPLLSLARKLSLLPPNCTAQFARTDTLGLRATRVTELAVLLDVCTDKKDLKEAADRSQQTYISPPPFLN